LRVAVKRLQDSEVRYRRLFETTHDGVLILDATSARVLEVNHFVTELLGYPPDHFLGKELWEIGVFKDAESCKHAVEILRKVGCIRYEDLPLQHEDGRHIAVEFVSNVYTEGALSVIQCNVRDISDRKTAEEAMCTSEGRYRTLFECAPDGILIVDRSSHYIDANPSICRMLGFTRPEMAQIHALDIVVPGEDQYVGEAFDVLKTQRQYVREWRFRRKDRSEFDTEVIATMMPDGNLMAMIRDITESKRVAQELIAAREAAVGANQAKSEFLANMSHEIRTPISAIIGFADLMLHQDQSPADRAEYIQIVRRNGKHLLDIINDILDLSKIESGKVIVETTRCDLPQFVAEVLSTMRLRASDKSLKIGVKFLGKIPRYIQIDAVKVRQILINLLANAIKFTDHGSIEMRVRYDSSNGTNVLTVDVQDTGIGLTADELGRLFHAFTQADKSTTRRFGGTGLGLTISRKLARLFGGDIQVKSTPGVGSTFSMSIDCGAEICDEMLEGLSESGLPTATVPTSKSNILLRGRILVAEDGRDNRRLLTTLLRTNGAEVSIAENGRIALDQALSQQFDLILMDMQMPEMDGYTASAELRRRGFRAPIIALTANAMSDDRAKCLAHGCTDYLSKPVIYETLLRTVARYLGETGAAAIPERSDLASSVKIDAGGTISSTLRDDPQMKEIVEQYIEGLPEEVTKLLDLLTQADLQSLRREVHQLRGSGGWHGFEAITKLAGRVEDSINNAEVAEFIQAQVEALIDVIRHVEGFDPNTNTIQVSEHASEKTDH
jgi:PAS domain S-box-containing protein